MKKRVHIFGASGSGTTTIAKEICNQLNYKHFDADDYFWLQTESPFTIERPREECLDLMEKDLSSNDKWILSGSLSGWGDAFIPLFDLVVFVYVPTDIRLERLKKREYERYGEEIFPVGSRFKNTKDFLDWAAAYDLGTRNGRSLPVHERWLQMIECQVIKIINDDLDSSIKTVLDSITMENNI